MSLLSMLQSVCAEVGITTEPTVAVTSTDRQIKQLISITHRVGNDLRSCAWPALQGQHEITLVDGQEAYAFPVDYDHDISETHWDQTSTNPLIGPLSPSEWQSLKNSQITSGITNRQFRIKGSGINRFFVDPTPSSTDAGDILVFEYQSINWIRPKTWTTSTAFLVGAYCFYDGYYFRATSAGTSGATAPTPTGLNDGGVVWEVATTPYLTFTADTDEFRIDEYLVGLGVQWNYLASKGLPYAHLEAKYNKDKMVAKAKVYGGETLSIEPGSSLYGSGYRNYRVTP